MPFTLADVLYAAGPVMVMLSAAIGLRVAVRAERSAAAADLVYAGTAGGEATTNARSSSDGTTDPAGQRRGEGRSEEAQSHRYAHA